MFFERKLSKLNILVSNTKELAPLAVLMGSAFSALMTSAFLGGVVSSSCLAISNDSRVVTLVCGVGSFGVGFSISFGSVALGAKSTASFVI